MRRTSNMYILQYYANPAHIERLRGAVEHISRIKYQQAGIQIELSETNSLVEDRYSLNLSSAKYIVEGCKETQPEKTTNTSRQAMIHHHQKGHQEKHLQFKLQRENEVIRITLENLNNEDYQRCIKGFLSISQTIIDLEKKEEKITADLQDFFFNEHIIELENDRKFLLKQVKQAYNKKAIQTDNGTIITPQKLQELKTEIHLLPFLDWEQ